MKIVGQEINRAIVRTAKLYEVKMKIIDEFFNENSKTGTKVMKTLNNERCMLLTESKLKELKERLK
jgi:hypothetical protein